MTSTPTELLARIQARCAERGITAPVAPSTPTPSLTTGKAEGQLDSYYSLTGKNNVSLTSSPLPVKNNKNPSGAAHRQDFEEVTEPAPPVPEEQQDNARSNEAAIEAAKRAIRPLPALDATTWMRVELFDNKKSSRGRSRYVLSIKASDDAPADVDTRSEQRNVKRFVGLQTAQAFGKSIRDFEPELKAYLEAAREEIAHHNEYRKAPNEPDALLGMVSLKNRINGTITYRTHVALLFWEERQIEDRWTCAPMVKLYIDGDSATIALKPETDPDRKTNASKYLGYRQTAEYIEYKQAQFRASRKN